MHVKDSAADFEPRLRQNTENGEKQNGQIVRPGHTTLRDVIVSAREAALQNVYAILAKELSPKQMEEIEALLVVAAPVPESAQLEESASRSRLEQFKAVARKESPESLLALLDQLSDVRSLGLTAWPALVEIIMRPAGCLRVGGIDTAFGICAVSPPRSETEL
ncbi:MAG: hypothetical protein WKF37_24770 [Bryobacteraceae bacterium]